MQDSNDMFTSLRDILCGKAPTAVFQPIIAINTGEIIGYEGLIRGPSNSALHAPLSLFKVARQCGFALEIEQICREVTLQRFVESIPAREAVFKCQSGVLDPPQQRERRNDQFYTAHRFESGAAHHRAHRKPADLRLCRVAGSGAALSLGWFSNCHRRFG